MENKKRSRAKRILLILVGLMLVCCLSGTAVSLITNRNLPNDEMDAAQLSALDKARLAEIFQLRQTLGDQTWPGWGSADIPVIVYNDAYAFLVGYEGQPLDGWLKVPGEEPQGNPWQMAPDDTFQGQPYFRSPLPEDGATPQAFTVQVGDQWAASLPTRPAMRVVMAYQFRDMLPGGLSETLPYTLVADIFLRNSDSYIGAVLHESFHAYQGLQTPARLAASEQTNIRYGDDYPHEEASFVADWQMELDLLQTAVRAETDAEAAELTEQFLAQRAARRANANLSTPLIDYERQREWQEGLALYVELDILRQAYNDNEYQSVNGMSGDPEFDNYQQFEQRWRQETDQITRMAGNDGDGRFYYSGMAQAALLDRLLPGWKDRIFDEGMFLEDLLVTAVAGS